MEPRSGVSADASREAPFKLGVRLENAAAASARFSHLQPVEHFRDARGNAAH